MIAGALKAALLCLFGDIGQRADQDLLLRPCSPADQRHRGFRRPAVGHEVCGDLREVFHPHVEDDGAASQGKPLPVDFRYFLAGMFMAGDEGDRGGDVAVGEGYAGIGGCADAGGDPRDDLKGDSGLDQRLAFLAAAAEDERVAPLEAGHDLPFQRLFHQQFVDLALLMVVGAADLAGIDQLGIGGGMLEQLLVGQIVVEDDIGAGDAFPSLDRDQAGIAGTGADQIDIAFFGTIMAYCSIPQFWRYSDRQKAKAPRRTGKYLNP